MGPPQLICLLALSLFVVGTALGQPTEPTRPGKSADEIQAIKQRAAEWLTTCLADWDTQTHMTKTEWQTTCERVARERGYSQLSTASITASPLARPRRRSLD